MKYKLLYKPETETQFLKRVLKDRLVLRSFNSDQETDRHYIGEALNYIIRLESELNELRARHPQQETNQ